MKETIEKLSRGIIEYDRPKIELSVNEIDMSVRAGSMTDGFFLIRSANTMPFKGVVFSSNRRIIIRTPYIVGEEGKIEFTVDGEHLTKDTEITGTIDIVTNGGEIKLPYIIRFMTETIETSVGKVRNLFHFANFVQSDYDEALRLFTSDAFKESFLQNDMKLLMIYEGLLESNNKSMALEEFLVAADKKRRINLTLSENQKQFKQLTETISSSVIISKDNWGYVYIEVDDDSDSFLDFAKRTITGEDFIGSNYEFTYLINVDRLHAGRNYASIRFKQGGMVYTHEVIVDCTNEIDNYRADIKKGFLKIYNKYLDFRLHKIGIIEWSNDTLALLENLSGMGEDTYFVKLMKAQVYLTMGRESEASWILENVAESLIESRNHNVEEYCYYLYVRSLQKRDSEFTKEMKNKIKEYYDNGHNTWQVLWVLLYMDESYDYNVTLKLARIKEQFNEGMRSPLMYYEAAAVFNSQPAFLRVLNDFELQTLTFALKRHFITEKLALHIAEIATLEKSMTDLLFRLLTELYEKYSRVEILETICSLLIKSGLVGTEYLDWYELGLQNELKLAGIYENYLASVDEEDYRPLPSMLLKYFIYNSDFNSSKLPYLYANIITNKEMQPMVYNNFLKQIERFAVLSIAKGKIDSHLAVIYKDMMTQTLITPELAETLPNILCSYMVNIKKNDIKNIIVVHKELDEMSVYPVINGKAFVCVFTSGAVILAEDIYHNRFVLNVEGDDRIEKIVKLFDFENHLEECYEISAENIGLSLHFVDQYIENGEGADKSIGILQLFIRMSQIREEYKQVIQKVIISFYENNYELDSIDEYLYNVDVTLMNEELRSRIIKLLIIRGHYDRAYAIISQYGFDSIEPNLIMKCATKNIESKGIDEDIVLVNMSIYAFNNGKYNEQTLDYINRYYNGTTDELIKIWEADNSYECESRLLDDRLIGQMLFAGVYPNKVQEVFEKYYTKGANDKIKKAYLVNRAYDYFVKNEKISDKVFEYIERELMNGEELNIICKMAYVKYVSEKDNEMGLSKEIRKLISAIVNQLCAKNIVLECYTKLKRFIKLPYLAEDKTVIEYRTSPEAKVFVSYMLETGSYEHKDYQNRELKSIYPGVFAFENVMFYGENLMYFITEYRDGKEYVTDKKNLYVADKELGMSKSRYGMLNDMMICQEMRKENEFVEVAKEYETERRLSELIFKIM